MQQGISPLPTNRLIQHPDIDRESLAEELRKPDWRGIFGQCGAALGHLENKNNEISLGDLFLFFGLFQETEEMVGDVEKLKFDKSKPEKHVIWGWLQVDDIIRLHDPGEYERLCKDYSWAEYHPHVLNKDIYKEKNKNQGRRSCPS